MIHDSVMSSKLATQKSNEKKIITMKCVIMHKHYTCRSKQDKLDMIVVINSGMVKDDNTDDFKTH